MSDLVNYFAQEKLSDVCYQYVSNMGDNAILACGFLRKEKGTIDKDLQLNYYGGFLLLQGEGYYIEKENRQEITKGSFIQRLPNVRHTTLVTSTEDWLEFFLCINTQSYNNLQALGFLSPNPVLHGELSEQLQEKLLAFFIKLKKSSGQELMPLFFEAQYLLCEITQSCEPRCNKTTLIQECVNMIHQFNGRISGREIAKKLNVSYETLRKRFKKEVCLSLEHYSILARLSMIKSEILTSNLSLSVIAETYGYGDYATFIKQFKQFEGITPAEYKRRHKFSTFRLTASPDISYPSNSATKLDSSSCVGIY